MVRIKRLELLRLTAPDPKSGVSANSTISAVYDKPEYNTKNSINQAKNIIFQIKNIAKFCFLVITRHNLNS